MYIRDKNLSTHPPEWGTTHTTLSFAALRAVTIICSLEAKLELIFFPACYISIDCLWRITSDDDDGSFLTDELFWEGWW